MEKATESLKPTTNKRRNEQTEQTGYRKQMNNGKKEEREIRNTKQRAT